MIDETLLSIIIPIYNTPENLLRNCLNSIEVQNNSHIEVLLIDDGSEEFCHNICLEYSLRNQNFLYYKHKNAGSSYTRNRGIELSKSDYLIFVDSDDTLEDTAVETIIREITENKIDLLIYNCRRYNSNNSIKDEHLLENNHIYMNETDKCKLYELLVYTHELSLVTTKVYVKNIILKNNIYFSTDMKWGEDIAFNIDYFVCCDKIKYIDVVLYNHFYRSNSVVTQIELKKLKDLKKEYNKRLSLINLKFRELQKNILVHKLKELILKEVFIFTANNLYIGAKKRDIKKMYKEINIYEILDISNNKLKIKILSILLKNNLLGLIKIAIHIKRFIKRG
ncbi:MAG: glycosyltransferase [Lachnospiraceae bacterium]|jgi:glycosyltransferase involved in cell wall biosynthesis|nr:glycosyltransferase [Lachnospiraceae bacterium]